jgi:hypothetical protein
LFEFNFGSDPRLRFGIYDQDEDDEVPFDNATHYWRRGLAVAAAKTPNSGPSIAIVNGPYFGLRNVKPRTADVAFHLAPEVLSGKLHYTGANHRWTFGTKVENGRIGFVALHMPTNDALKQLDFGAGTAQCVVHNGKALHLQPLPRGTIESKPPSALPSTAADAGPIRVLDWMKTSRVSFGWNRDSSKLWLLFVKEPDGETTSRAAVLQSRAAVGGWTLADVQRFWLALGATDAVVTDGGDVAQLAYRTASKADNHNWFLVPPRFSTAAGAATKRFSPSSLAQIPKAARVGGALSYFMIWRTAATPHNETRSGAETKP